MTLPSHLSQTHATGIQKNQLIAQFEVGVHRNFVYLILDWSKKKAALVDPHSGMGPVLKTLDEQGFELTSILLTHSHWDHIAGLPELSHSLAQVPVYVHPLDEHRIREQRKTTLPIHPLQDQQIIIVGSLEIKVMHTPGHSPGECCYLVQSQTPYLFTGDTIFIRDCGRTDLEGGNDLEMFESIQKIKALPPETIILPGHHYKTECASTLEVELRESPPFQCKTANELAQLP